MPTAADFRTVGSDAIAAAADAAAARQLVIDAEALKSWQGGEIAPSVESAINANVSTLDTVGRQLDELAAECERRATVCDEYDAALDAWKRSDLTWQHEHQRYRDTQGTRTTPTRRSSANSPNLHSTVCGALKTWAGYQKVW